MPDDDYAAFIAQRAPDAAHDGVIVDQEGRVLARHGGIHRFTVGQRKGLGLPSSPTGAPMYVLALSPRISRSSSARSRRSSGRR